MVPELSQRELFIISLVADGLTNKQIADILNTPESRFKYYLCEIYDKLSLWNRVELSLWYIKNVEILDDARERAASIGSGR